MPNLPGLTVSDAQLARITAAFGSVANYKAWLKTQVINYVVLYEDRQFDQQYLTDRAARRAANENSLNDIA